MELAVKCIIFNLSPYSDFRILSSSAVSSPDPSIILNALDTLRTVKSFIVGSNGLKLENKEKAKPAFNPSDSDKISDLDVGH